MTKITDISIIRSALHLEINRWREQEICRGNLPPDMPGSKLITGHIKTLENAFDALARLEQTL